MIQKLKNSSLETGEVKNNMHSEALIRELPKGLLKWYEFHKEEKALFVTGHPSKEDVLAEALEECGLKVDVMTLKELKVNTTIDSADRVYSYIVITEALEYSGNPEKVLKTLHRLLKENGRLLLGLHNRLGIRYFCGDRDPFTGRNFDGIENYTRVNPAGTGKLEGRAYAKAEIEEMLEKTGFCNYRFYSVFPEIVRPQIMFAEDFLPEEELEIRVLPQYHYPDTVFLEEERLYTTLIQNGLFHTMANGYLVECSMDGSFANAKQITVSMDRGKENALYTITRRDEKVEKKAAYAEGCDKLQTLWENNEDLKSRGIAVIDAVLQDGSYVMPYVKGENATDYFRGLLKTDKNLFIKELDRFWEIIKKSSEQTTYDEVDWEKFDPEWKKRKADDPNKDKWKKIAFGTEEEQENLGIILKRGYIDLVALNCFVVDGEFIFYDQEFSIENLPANVMLQRTIDFIYRGNVQMEKILPKKDLEERYHLSAYQQLWYQWEGYFLRNLRSEETLSAYHRKYRRDMGVLNSNRQRLNYSQDEYERIFRNIFQGIEGKKVILFGSGNFAKTFIERFRAEYDISGILDNNSAKWGTTFFDIPIYSPEYLHTLEEGSYKVIICIKNYLPIIKQLEEIGVKNYGIYDSNLSYPRKEKKVADDSINGEKAAPKKYHVGYIAGVFDLFHVGHLNLFKRAKELCDYLIVGVVSDESVMNSKKTMPYVPFEERIEMVRSCRYVDEAVAIPPHAGDTDEAYRRYQFDVQFSGSDYENDPVWLAKKVFLQKQGSDLVFFPYTQGTSSTKLKAAIEERTK